MIRRTAAIAFLLAGSMLAPVAMAQQTGLTYVEPLSAEGVRQVQSKLNTLGGFVGPVDGIWGPASESNLRAFQQSHGLQATGELNPATAAMLGLDPSALVLATAPSPPAPVAAPVAAQVAPPVATPAPSYALSSDSMRIIQARLHQLGFYNGAVDAVWGQGTLTALQSFQSSKGLAADGRLTKATVLALGIDPTTMQPQP